MSRPRPVASVGRDAPRSTDRQAAEWFSAAPESEGFPHYLAILRSKIWFIVLTVAICVAAALLALSQAQSVYQSGADLLVTPVSADNSTLVGLGLPAASSDPGRDIETVARLIKTQGVAARVIKQLKLDTTPAGLLKKVSVTPLASSNVVTVTAKGDSPEGAARLANVFAAAAVADRTARLHEQLDQLIPQVRSQIASLGDSAPVETRAALVSKLRDLQTLRAGSDPTVRLEVRAEPNASAISPRPALTLAAAVIAGLFIGAGAVLLSQLVDPRLRREEQLRRYRVPILARVPLERGAGKGRRGRGPLTDGLSFASRDSYGLLAATLNGMHGRRSLLVTGPNPGDGKTTSAINLAAALGSLGKVILVEGDSRRPMLARALGLVPRFGLASVLAGRVPLKDALLADEKQAPNVRFLVQSSTEPILATVSTTQRVETLVDDAMATADWMVIDAPPLTAVPDALPFATSVDDVLLVVRLGNTRLKQLEQLAELLVHQDVTPVGFVLIGGKPSSAYYG